MIINSYIYAGDNTLYGTYPFRGGYSLRYVSNEITDVVRVRRSSDSAEADFTPTEVTDGTLTTWTGANDGFVVTLFNQGSGGSTFDITQGTAGSQPKLVSSGTVLTKGSLPAILYDGTDDFLHYNGGAIIQGDCSMFSVSSSTSTETVTCVYSSAATATNGQVIVNDSRTAVNRHFLVASDAADLSTAYVDTNQRLLASFVDGSKNMSAFDNSNTGGTDTYTTETADTTRVGKRYNASPLYMAGEIQEVILYNTDETSNRSGIEGDINTYYSIY